MKKQKIQSIQDVIILSIKDAPIHINSIILLIFAILLFGCGEFTFESKSNTQILRGEDGESSDTSHEVDLLSENISDINTTVKYEENGRDIGNSENNTESGANDNDEDTEDFQSGWTLEDYKKAGYYSCITPDGSPCEQDGSGTDGTDALWSEFGKSEEPPNFGARETNTGNNDSKPESGDSLPSIDLKEVTPDMAYAVGKNCESISNCMKPILELEKWKKLAANSWEKSANPYDIWNPYLKKLAYEAMDKKDDSWYNNYEGSVLDNADLVKSVKESYLEGLFSNKYFIDVLKKAEYNAIKLSSSEAYLQTLLSNFASKMVIGNNGSMKPMGLTVEQEEQFYNTFKEWVTKLAGKINYLGVLKSDGETVYGLFEDSDNVKVGIASHVNDIIRADQYVWEQTQGQLEFKDLSDSQVSDYLADYISATIIHEFAHNVENIFETIGLGNASSKMTYSEDGGFDHIIMDTISSTTGLAIETGSQHTYPSRALDISTQQGLYIINTVTLGL